MSAKQEEIRYYQIVSRVSERKRSTGFFAISNLDGTAIHNSVNVKKSCRRLSARSSTLVIREETALSSHD